MVLILNIVKELNEAKICLEGIDAEVKSLIEMCKLGEPMKSGILTTLQNMHFHCDNIMSEVKKLETTAPSYAKVDLSTGIKKVVK